MENFEFRIKDLSRLDVAALEKIAPGAFRVEEPARDPRQHNELATLAIIGGIGIVAAAAGYVFGKHQSEDIELDVEIVVPDGTKKSTRLRISRKSTEPVDTQIMSQIKAVLGQ